MKKDQRLEYLRVVSCLMVILGHIANWYMREYPNLPLNSYICALLLNGACRVSVPLFFMVSGALILEQPTDYKKNGKRTLAMLIKTVLWTAIYVVWDFLYLGEEYSLRNIFSEPVRTHFWFMLVIVGIYATVPFWQKLVSGDSFALLKYFSILYIAITAISFAAKMLKMGISYEFPLVGSTSCYTGLFIMGYVIRHYIDRIKIKKWISIITVILCMTATNVLTLIFTLNTGRHYEGFSNFRSIFIILASLSVFYLFMKAGDLREHKWMAVISKYSFGIYMTHVFFLDILQQNIKVSKVNAWLGTPIFFVILFISSLAFTWLYEKAQGKHRIL